jgi:hypothetical protein
MFLRAKSLSPNDSTVYQHYGELTPLLHLREIILVH